MYDTGITPLIFHAVDPVISRVASFDSNTIEKIRIESKNNRRVNVVRNARIMMQCEEIADIFRKENIEFIYLKGGASLLTNVWKSPQDRQLSDLDILIKPETTKQAIACLHANGYAFRAEEIDRFSTHHHLPPLIHRSQSKVPLELHIKAGPSRYDLDLSPIDLFSECISATNDIAVLNPKHQISLALLHGSQQLKARNKIYLPLKDLLEYSLLVRKYPSAVGILKYKDLPLNLFTNLNSLLFSNHDENRSSSNNHISLINTRFLKGMRPGNYSTNLNHMEESFNPGKFVVSILSESPKTNMGRISRLFTNVLRKT